jgi:hypothetical protein
LIRIGGFTITEIVISIGGIIRAGRRPRRVFGMDPPPAHYPIRRAARRCTARQIVTADKINIKP